MYWRKIRYKKRGKRLSWLKDAGLVVENIHTIENINQSDYSMKRTQRFKRVSKPKKPIPYSELDEDSAANLSTQLLKSKSTRINPKRPKILSLPTSTSLTFDHMTILPREFFQIDALDLAPRLLGKFLKRDNVVLQITEVEAYRPNDSACHGRFGITARTAPVFGPGGHAYVYLCYGLHTMLNVVADKEGNGAAVLIRSCAPISAAHHMKLWKNPVMHLSKFSLTWQGWISIQERQGKKTEKPDLLNGPGKIGQALGISTEWSNHPLHSPDGPEPENILVGPRVGIDYALPEHVSAPWRFAIAGTAWISAPKNTLRPP